MAEKKNINKGIPPDLIEKDIVRTRNEMSHTIDEIEERLSAEHWRSVVKEKAKEKKDSAVAFGKKWAEKAKSSARSIGRSASQKSSNAQDQAMQFIKNNQVAASAIAFEVGAWIAIAAQRAVKNRAGKKKEAGGTEYAKAKIMSIEEVEEKVQKAALSPEEGHKKAA